MPLFTVNTPFNIELEFSLATFPKRMFAWLIDLAIIFLYSYVMLLFVFDNVVDGLIQDYNNQNKLGFVLGLFTIAIPVMLYHLLFEIFMNGRSPGKFFLGIKVMNKEGASASLSQLLIRWILCIPNYFLIAIVMVINPGFFIAVLMILGFASLPDIISIAATANLQRLGDLAAGTVVVDTKYKMNIAETIYVEVQQDEYKPVFPEVLQLTDRDINGIRNLLNNKITKDTENYTYRVAYRIEEVLNIKMNSEPITFLQTLLKDYNYLTQHKN